MTQIHFHRSILLILMSMALLGCESAAPKGHVAKQWAQTMRELDIVPVFPPREDVQVGDVYIVPEDPEREDELFARDGHLPRGIWVHTLSLQVELSRFYQSRASLPATTFSGDHVAGSGGEPTDADVRAEPAESDVFMNGSVQRLRIVGFPSFLSMSITQGDMSVFLPVETAMITGSAAFSDTKSVTVNLPVAESCGLPANLVMVALKREAIKGVTGEDDESPVFRPLDGIGGLLPMPKRHLIPATGPDGIETEVVRVRVATEVFYARVVDVSIQAQTEKSGMLTAVADALVGSYDTRKSTQSDETTTTSTTAQPLSAKEELEGFGSEVDGGVVKGTKKDRSGKAGSLSSPMISMSGDIPGSTVRILSVSESSVGMRRVYERPVAIGFRGFDANIILESKTGRVISVEPLGVTESSLPRALWTTKATP